MRTLILLFLFCSVCSADIIQTGQVTAKGMRYETVPLTPRILPFGASNTGGQSSGPAGRLFAYRRGLQQALGVGNYDIVGDFTDPDSDATYDVDHSGVGGQTTATLEARLAAVLSTYMPGEIAGDIVILDTGTNDSCLDSAGDREGARDNYEDMIDIVYAAKPNTKIIATISGPVKIGTPACVTGPAFDDVQAFHDITLTMLQSKQATVPTLYIADGNAYCQDGAGGQCGANCDNCLYDVAHFTEDGYTYNGFFYADAITDCGGTEFCYEP